MSFYGLAATHAWRVLIRASSRPVPHRNLKRFLGPAFTVSSVDKLDTYFMTCCGTLMNTYYANIEKRKAAGEGAEFKTDLMRDLHCLALDM